MNTETRLMLSIREALIATGRVLLWRNNVGRYKRGKHWIQYGLGVGSPDLVGILRPHGRMFAIEVKTPKGEESHEQSCWQGAARQAGAIVATVRSVDEAMALLRAQ